MLIIGLSDFLMMAACASMTEIKAAWYQFKNFTMYHCQNNSWLEHVLWMIILWISALLNIYIYLSTLPSLVTHYCFLSITRPFQKISILLPPQWKWQMSPLPSSDISRTTEVYKSKYFFTPLPFGWHKIPQWWSVRVMKWPNAIFQNIIKI